VALALSLTVTGPVGCTTAIDPAYLRLVQAPVEGPAPSANTLGAGDKLSVRVYDEEKLGGEFVVAPGGTINFPLVGKLKVDGLTCAEIEDEVTRRLTEGYLHSPSVSCSVLEFESKKVAVFGEVNSPGNFRYVDRMTIVQAVADAGGFKDTASQDGTTVVRVVQGEERTARVPVSAILAGEVANLELLPGDIIVVPRSIY
jgi:protein involved in polysaccharide export with SLBB domain